MSDPEELKPVSYPQQTPNTKSKAQKQHQEYLQKLSEKSRLLKQQRESEELTKEKQLEKQFSVYNNGANQKKKTDKQEAAKNIKKWNDSIDQSDQPVYGVQKQISPSVQQTNKQDQYEDTLIGLVDQNCYDQYNQQDNYQRQDQTLQNQQTLDQQPINYQPYQQHPPIDQMAPKESLFILDTEGNQVPVIEAINNPFHTFNIEQPKQNQFEPNLSDTEFGITKDLEGSVNLAQTKDLNEFPDLADDQIKPDENCAQSFKMIALNTVSAEYGLSPAQMPETLFMLLNAMDQLPQSNFNASKTQTEMILCDDEEQVEGDYTGECEIENMAENGQLVKADDGDKVDNEVAIVENQVEDEKQKLEKIVDEMESQNNEVVNQQINQTLIKTKKLPKPLKQKQLSFQDQNNESLKRCEQLYESLKGNGIEVNQLVYQLQKMSTDEQEEVLIALKEAEQGEQSGLKSIKDSIHYSQQIQQYQSNIKQEQVSQPPKIRTISGKRPISSELHKERVPSATPKPLNHTLTDHSISGLPNQLPRIMKMPQSESKMEESLKISQSTSFLQSYKQVSQVKQEVLVQTQILLIELNNVYPINDAIGTIVPNLLSSDKSPIFIVYKSSLGKQEVQKQESSRIIVDTIPPQNGPVFIFTIYNESIRYVLSQDQRKGRMRVAMPKDFKAKIWQLDHQENKPIEDFILDFCANRKFKCQSSCLLECVSYLPISLNQITPDNSLVFKKPTLQPKTPRIGTPKLEKSQRLRQNKDQIEIEILSNYGGNQTGLNSVLLFDINGNKIRLPNDDITIASTDKPEAIMNLFLYQNLDNDDPRKQWCTQNSVTASIIITLNSHLKVSAMKILNFNSKKEQNKATRDISVKFNNEIVKHSELSQSDNNLDQIDFIVLRQEIDLADYLQKLIVNQDQEYQLQKSKSKEILSQFTPRLQKISTPTTNKVTPTSLKIQNNGFEIKDFSSFSITIVPLDVCNFSANGYSIGDIKLQSINKDIIDAKTLQATGADYIFKSRGVTIEPNQMIDCSTDLAEPILSAHRLENSPRNSHCRITFQFAGIKEDTITHLLINNFAENLDNSLRQCLILVNGVLQNSLPGIFLPQCLFNTNFTASSINYTLNTEKQINTRQIQQNYLQDIQSFTPILLKQGTSKSAQELQKQAQNAGDFFNFIQSKFNPEQRVFKGNNQIHLIHQKVNNENLTYVTAYQPSGYAIQIDVLSHHLNTNQFGISLLHLFQNGKDQIQLTNASIQSNLMTSTLIVDKCQISDSQFPASSLLTNQPWVVKMQNFNQIYSQNYQNSSVLASLYVKFCEKQEISGIQLISDNVAEICVSMDGRVLFEGRLADNGNIQQISFSKSKIPGDQFLI